MPELPEVETVCRALRPLLTGRRLTGVEALVRRLRTRIPLAALRRHAVGRRILGVRRRAKYIVVDLAGGRALVLHLGMTGGFRLARRGATRGPHDRLVFGLSGSEELVLRDARRFAEVRLERPAAPGDWPACLADLGPEPLGASFTSCYLREICRSRRRPIKNLLMDQRLVVGVGNIYASEALWRARVRPTRPGRSLSASACGAIVRAVREVLRDAIRMGGTTVRDFRSLGEATGRFRLRLAVYGRAGEPCRRCRPDHPVRRLVQAGRSTFYCPACQS